MDKLYKLNEDQDNRLKKLEGGTADVVAAFEAARGAFKVFEFIGRLARPFLWIAGLGTVVVTATKHMAASQNPIIKAIVDYWKG